MASPCPSLVGQGDAHGGCEAGRDGLELRVKQALQAMRGRVHLDELRGGLSDDSRTGGGGSDPEETTAAAGEETAAEEETADEQYQDNEGKVADGSGKGGGKGKGNGMGEARQAAHAQFTRWLQQCPCCPSAPVPDIGKLVGRWCFPAPSPQAVTHRLLQETFLPDLLRRRMQVESFRSLPWEAQQIGPGRACLHKTAVCRMPVPAAFDLTAKPLASNCANMAGLLPPTQATVLLDFWAVSSERDQRLWAVVRFQGFSVKETLVLNWRGRSRKVLAHAYMKMVWGDTAKVFDKAGRLKAIKQACRAAPVCAAVGRQLLQDFDTL